MRGRQDHLGLLESPPIVTIIEPSDLPPLPVPPDRLLRIEPAPIAKMRDHLAMGTAATLASPLRPLEPNDLAKLAPIDWVETPNFWLDRHR